MQGEGHREDVQAGQCRQEERPLDRARNRGRGAARDHQFWVSMRGELWRWARCRLSHCTREVKKGYEMAGGAIFKHFERMKNKFEEQAQSRGPMNRTGATSRTTPTFPEPQAEAFAMTR